MEVWCTGSPPGGSSHRAINYLPITWRLMLLAARSSVSRLNVSIRSAHRLCMPPPEPVSRNPPMFCKLQLGIQALASSFLDDLSL